MEARKGQGEHLGIADAFVAARRTGGTLADYPGIVPATLDDAYHIQDRAVALAGGMIAGWKVGRILPPLDARYGSDRLAGPIFANAIFDEAEAMAMPVFGGGFGAVEAEFLLRIGTSPDPAKFRFSLDEAAALIDAVHVGIEIASSPFAGINALGPTATISDFGNNNGLVVGDAVVDWRDWAFARWRVELRIDGLLVGSGRADMMPDGPVGAARFLFELMARRHIALLRGQWISSGAVTGVHAVASGAAVEARFGEAYAVDCTISAAADDGG